ncbi:hypothetical protein ACFLQL_00705 [Verrucomicrobiota bacterium]
MIKRAIVTVERDKHSDIFGHYNFRVMAIRFETVIDIIIHWIINRFRKKIKKKDIKDLDIFNIITPDAEGSCKLEVVPTPALCKFLYKVKTKEDTNE